MVSVLLGKTGIRVEKNGFGALPIQRITQEEAVRLLHQAFDGGIRYFDTARSYTDSEEKLGAAFGGGKRAELFLATITPSQTAEGFWKDLETSLRLLRTDYIDVYQFHNPPFCPKPGDGSGLYEAMLEAKKQGKIRHIAITNHRLAVAREAVESGLYDLLQFPFSYLADPKEEELVRLCAEKNVGFVAMKALSGGLITNSADLGCPAGERAAGIPVLCLESACYDAGAFRRHCTRPPGAGGQFLPWLRLLPAVSRWDRYPDGGAHVPAAAPFSDAGLAERGQSGENAARGKLHPLQPLRESLSLRS